MTDYDATPLETVCPACHHGHGHRLYTVTAQESAQHFVVGEAQPERHAKLQRHIADRWRQDTCDLVRCDACAFTFAQPFIAGDATFYNLAFDEAGHRGWTWEYTRTLDALTELAAAGDLTHPRVLELGAGNGVFARAVAPALTPKASVLCTEFSSSGKRAIEDSGIACLEADVRDSALDPYVGRVEVVCMFQVLEHLDRLDELFERFNELATPGAHLFAAVPNERRIEFNELNGSLLDMPPNHVGRWTRSAFDALGARHGWRVAAHEIEPHRALGLAKQYAAYRYVRRRQDPRSLANQVERLGRSPVQRALKVGVAAVYALARVGTIARGIRTEGLGDSQWIHLRRAEG